VNTQAAEARLGESAEPFKDDSVYFCGGGVQGFALNAYGEMGHLCDSQQDTFSIRDVGSTAGLGGSLAALRNRKRTRVTKCIECRFSRCVDGVREREMENGDKESPVDFFAT